MIQKSKFRTEGGLARASKKGQCSISEGGGWAVVVTVSF